MRMRQFTPRQPPDDIRITSQEYEPDPDVSLKHDDLWARAWECDYEQPIIDAENNIVALPTSTEIPVQSDISAEETRNTPVTAHKCSPEFFPQLEELSDVSRHGTRCGGKLGTTGKWSDQPPQFQIQFTS